MTAVLATWMLVVGGARRLPELIRELIRAVVAVDQTGGCYGRRQ